MENREIPNGWIETTLGEVVSLAQGVAINAKTNHVLCDENEGLPLLKINNLVNNTVDQYANPKLVPQKAILEKDDVVFTRTGQVGWVFTGKYGILHNNSFKVMPNEALDKKYLFWFLKQKSVYEYAQRVASGSAQPDLNHDAFKTIGILMPPLYEQKAIADVLSSLDEKIELLEEENKTLETLAQTIFTEWFVNFNFPGATGEIEDSELGEIPKGWRVGKLDTVSKILAGGDKPENISTIKTDKFSIPIYSNGVSEYGLFGYTDSARIFEESITVSARGTIGYVCLRTKPYVPIVRLISVIPNNLIISSKYLFFWFKNKAILGSGTTQQQLTIPQFRTTSILIPDTNFVNLFTQTANSLYEKIENNREQIQTLKTTRDTLLPKLMSGEIRVEGFGG